MNVIMILGYRSTQDARSMPSLFSILDNRASFTKHKLIKIEG
jgi:hypothetical protein